MMKRATVKGKTIIRVFSVKFGASSYSNVGSDVVVSNILFLFFGF